MSGTLPTGTLSTQATFDLLGERSFDGALELAATSVSIRAIWCARFARGEHTKNVVSGSAGSFDLAGQLFGDELGLAVGVTQEGDQHCAAIELKQACF